ncbi:heavy metal translocating P-type ATPase [Campylobacter geochelonis]|uniref:heavy metal translocating P-type ATPase n=1 Tax=Campylobacter geochelonis TaxID=1780362 RepID=UPI00077087CF|nr:cation-translocating P-type ATPase [Campylobacter geochelonis]CZE48544.1 tetrapyrrole methylase [Campylobacter geochelonis]CZE51156.1 tetrapyrrole methylase [Campylobacter geochelonis]
MLNNITIKSQTKTRIRLKSKNFNKAQIRLISSILAKENLAFRINEKCHSVIINFNPKNISINEILAIFKAFDAPKIEQKTVRNRTLEKKELSKPACEVCSSCKISTPIPWKRRLLEFAVLSVFAAYVFIKESILGVAVASTPLSLVGIVSLVAAIPLFKESLDDVKNRRFTLQTFMTFSLLLAIFGSQATAAFEIIYILRGSMLFEDYTAEKSKREIRNLIKNDVKKAYKLEGDLEIETDLSLIKPGDILACRSGEKIPVDGLIVSGQALIDESIINGRSEAETKTKNDEVFANTFIEKGRILVEVRAKDDETYIGRVIKEVEKSLSVKSDGEIAAQKLAARTLKLGSLLTVLTFGLTGSFARAFAVMIVMSCPCSTVLAASSAVSAGIARGAKEGILIKGGKYLEAVSDSDVFCFDKTGTLTTKEPEITDVITKFDEKTLFSLAYMLERRNTHPLAVAICKKAQELGISANFKASSEVLAGLGVSGEHDGAKILIGNAKLLREYKVDILEYQKDLARLLDEGKSVVFVAKDGKAIGVIGFKHKVRENTQDMLKMLRKRGVKHLVLLSGDETKVASAFAREYGFDEVYADLMPQDKAEIIRNLRKKYNKIVMIGDGINDTLALSLADVGISFASGGSEAAIEVSNIAITHSHPLDVVNLYDISKLSLKTVNQNYYIGMGTNILGVALAAVGLLTPVLAGTVHLAHTAGIILNSSKISLKKEIGLNAKDDRVAKQ